MNITDLTKSELEVYNWCIKMGDSHELAIESVLIHRNVENNRSVYNNAYID